MASNIKVDQSPISSIASCGVRPVTKLSSPRRRATSTQASGRRVACAGAPGIKRRNASPCESRMALCVKLDSTRAFSSQGSTGLCRKSSAPNSMQRATGATPPSELVTITDTSRSWSSAARSSSRPKPSSSGMARSSINRSKRCSRISTKAWRPFCALLTRWPISSSERHSSSLLTLLSSATSTLPTGPNRAGLDVGGGVGTSPKPAPPLVAPLVTSLATPLGPPRPTAPTPAPIPAAIVNR